ncbi:MAG TPA: hypothetical protein VMM84_17405 [Pyrinomonadaceae bacterium]|nr:hypothetical protein [Pyrinomonadaceae bacterium]
MKTRTFAAGFLFLLMASTVHGQEHSSDGGWSKFTSEKGRFSVLMPGDPSENVEITDSPHGPYTTNMFTLSADNRFFMVAWVEYDPNFNFGVQAELNANRDNFVKGFNARLTGATRQITLEGNPGIEFTAERDDAFVKSRVYVVGRRPYMLVGISRNQNDTEVDRFLSSLEMRR